MTSNLADEIHERHECRMLLLELRALTDSRGSLVRRSVRAGLGKTEIARILGVNRDTIYEWLKGENRAVHP